MNHARVNERLVMCEATLDELATRLDRSKFDGYISQDMRRVFLQELRDVAQWQPNPVAAQGIVRSRDANDNVFIDLALQSKAHLLISGDKDLLVLADALFIQGLQVLPPSEAFLVLQTA